MIKQIIMTSLFVFIALTVIIYVFQRQLIYFPTKETPDRQAFHAEDMQLITLHTHDGLYLHSWYKPAAIGKPTFLFLHGNAGNIGGRMPLARQFISEGYGVFLLEYRGYGGNKGRPTEQGLYIDGRTAMQFLIQHGVSFKQVVLYGESLGTGVATQLATEYPSCAVVLQSPFTSLTDIARYRYPWILIPPIDKFDSFAHIRSIHAPVLILHGTQDLVVPFAQGRALFQQANEPKQWVALPGKGHSDMWDSDFVREISDFVDLHCEFFKQQEKS